MKNTMAVTENGKVESYCQEHLVKVTWIRCDNDGWCYWECPEGHTIIEES